MTTVIKRCAMAIAAAAMAITLPAMHLRGAAALPSCDADNGGLKLPEGFCALVVADGLGAARHLVAAPNGDLYVAILQSRTGTGLWALRDANGDGKFEIKEPLGETGGTGIAIHDGYLYLATTTSVLRWKMTANQLKPAAEIGRASCRERV